MPRFCSQGHSHLYMQRSPAGTCALCICTSTEYSTCVCADVRKTKQGIGSPQEHFGDLAGEPFGLCTPNCLPGSCNCLGVFSRMKAAELAPQVADFRVTVPINIDSIAFIRCWDATEQRLLASFLEMPRTGTFIIDALVPASTNVSQRIRHILPRQIKTWLAARRQLKISYPTLRSCLSMAGG